MASSVPDESYTSTLDDDTETEAYEKDSQILLGILPATVWSIVGETVAAKQKATENPSKPITNMINSSPYFRTLLYSKRNTLLFGQVWKVLAKSVVGKAEDDDVENANDVSGEKHSNVLTCRLVCKAWEKEVDRWIYNGGYAGLELSRGEKKAKENAKQVEFENSGQTKRFLDFFKDYKLDLPSKRNRAIVGREVRITLSETAHITEPLYLNHLKIIMRNFGRSGIWSLEVVLKNHDDSLPTFEFYGELSRILNEVRGLRKLSTHYSSSCPIITNDHWLDLIHQFTGNGECANTSIPHFPKLTDVKMHGRRNIFFSKLLKVNDHLKSLDFAMIKGFDIFKHSFPNLDYMVLHLKEWGDHGKIENMQGSWPKLRHLELNFMDHYNVVEFNWGRFWEILGENWGNSLTSLEISLPRAWKDLNSTKSLEITNAVRNGVAKFPKLERIKLKIVNLQIYLDFLLPFKETLKRIDIWIPCLCGCPCVCNLIPEASQPQPDLDDYEQIVEFVGYEDKMLESNIWRLFTKLECFEVWMQKLRFFSGYSRHFKNRKIRKN